MNHETLTPHSEAAPRGRWNGPAIARHRGDIVQCVYGIRDGRDAGAVMDILSARAALPLPAVEFERRAFGACGYDFMADVRHHAAYRQWTRRVFFNATRSK